MANRKITDQEIKALELQLCSAEDWAGILVDENFKTALVRNVHFAGNVELGKEVRLLNVGVVANYRIGDNVSITNINRLATEGESSFGNGIEIDVLNEGGGREVPIFDNLTAQLGYLLAAYRHDADLISSLKKMVLDYTVKKRSKVGFIGDNSNISDCNTIKNVNVGEFVDIDGAISLEEGSIIGEENVRTKVGRGVIASGFIVQSGSKIESGALINNSFIGQGVQIGKQFSMENCLFFANSEGFHGEAVSVFAGPYTVSHHKSSLLIAGMYSFFNAGSGTNQSNHMYKLGPIHQGIMERGCKTGSFSYLLWPSKVGVFSVVMGKHGGNFDTTDFPFSYVTVDGDRSFLTPAMNLITVGTKRDTDKWPQRDRREGNRKLDLIIFELFNPFVMQEVIRGIDTLSELYEKTPKEQESLNYKGVRIKRLMLKSCKKYYEMALQIFLGDQLIKNMDKPQKIKVVGEKWLDISGLVIPDNVFDGILESVKAEVNLNLKEFSEMLKSFHGEYDDYTWSWTVALLKIRFNIDITKMESEDITGIMTNWKNSRIRLNNMILSDAKKEFDSNSQIGYGLGENEVTEGRDFESTRGEYDANSFVNKINEDSKTVEKEYERITGIHLGK